MAKAAGRLAALKKAGTPIGGVKISTLKWAGESIDVTDRDSNGIIELLSTVKSQQLTLDVEGIQKDAVLRDIAMDPTVSKMLTDLSFVFADALAAKDTIAGNFFMNGYEDGNPHDDAATFKCSFVSSGTWTLS